jgi:hypothetical protein
MLTITKNLRLPNRCRVTDYVRNTHTRLGNVISYFGSGYRKHPNGVRFSFMKKKENITFPQYFKALKVKKFKELTFNILMICTQLIGIVGILLLAYGLLINLHRYLNQDHEQGVERADYSPYSGWTYE